MKSLYILACVLLALAVVLRLVALHSAARSARTEAKGMTLYEPMESDDPRSYGYPGPEEPYFAEAKQLARLSETISVASFAAMLPGVGLFIYSFACGFRKLTAIPIVLIAMYVAFSLIIV